MDRDTKLIAILRRQYHIILTALGENIFRIRDSAQYGIYFLPTSRQYNVVLPSQNRNLFLKWRGAKPCQILYIWGNIRTG